MRRLFLLALITVVDAGAQLPVSPSPVPVSQAPPLPDPAAPDPSAPSPGGPNAAPSAPDPNAAILPPTWSDRRQVFFRRLFGPQAILETVPGTAFDTARGFPRQWGRGTAGIAKRLGSQYGQFLVGETIELAVSALHHEDPRYFRMPGASFGKRLRHSLGSAVIVRGANGAPTIALARLADVYGSWAIATTWNPPDQRNLVKIFGNGSLGLGLKAGGNVFREFWPDVKRRLKRH